MGLAVGSMAQMSKRKLAAVLAYLLLVLASRHVANAVAGDSFLGDLITADQSNYNFGVYTATKGYGTVSFIDNGEAISWEVDIFQTPSIATSIELALATPGLPLLLPLTDANNPPSLDGISFGLIDYSTLANVIAASAYPAASLKDGTIVVVAKFDKPPNSALIAQVSDGSTITHMVFAPPSPPSTTPPAPDMYALHPGVDPEIFYSQLDGAQVSILESGITNPSNGTASLLMYDWQDGTLSWEMETNGVASPHSLELHVFVDLVNQPLLLEVAPNEPWSPDTLSYTGIINKTQIEAALAALDMAEVGLHDYTPRLFFQLMDGELPQATTAGTEAGSAADETTDSAAVPAPGPAPASAQAPKPKSPTPTQTPATATVPVSRPANATGPAAAPAPGQKVPPVKRPPPAFEPLWRRRMQQQVGTVKDEAGPVAPDPTLAAAGGGTCGAELGPSRILGFIFDTNSRWKLKPVLKDTSDLPGTVKYLPLLISGVFLAVTGIILIAFHIAGTVESTA